MLSKVKSKTKKVKNPALSIAARQVSAQALSMYFDGESVGFHINISLYILPFSNQIRSKPRKEGEGWRRNGLLKLKRQRREK